MTRGGTFEVQGALQVARNLGALADRLPWIQRRAIQTLRRRLPVEARRDIQREYNLGAQRINKDLTARVLADGVRLVGRWRGIGLVNFGARPVKQGVTAAILLGRRTLFPHAFKATLLSGNVQVVSRVNPKREMKRGRYKGKRRQPLAVEYGATVAQMLGKARRPERLAEFARGVLQAKMLRLIAVYERGSTTPSPSEN